MDGGSQISGWRLANSWVESLNLVDGACQINGWGLLSYWMEALELMGGCKSKGSNPKSPTGDLVTSFGKSLSNLSDSLGVALRRGRTFSEIRVTIERDGHESVQIKVRSYQVHTHTTLCLVYLPLSLYTLRHRLTHI